MDRGILMSIEGHHGVVLTKDGAFRKVRLAHPQSTQLGEEIPLPSRAFLISKPVVSALAACLILFVVFSSLGLGERNKAVAAYISFDINPSFEVGVDQHLHVLTLHPLNKDGARVINEIKPYKNLKLEDFTKKVATVLDQDGYFKGNPNMVVSLTVTSKVQKTSQKSFETLVDQAVSEIRSQPHFAAENGNLQILSTTPKQRQEALNLGLTAGKYSLYVKAKQEEPNVTVKLAKEMTVSDLVKTAHLSTPVKALNSKPAEQAGPNTKSQVKAQVNKHIPSEESMDKALPEAQQSLEKVKHPAKPVRFSQSLIQPEKKTAMRLNEKSAVQSNDRSRHKPAVAHRNKSMFWTSSCKEAKEKKQGDWHKMLSLPSVTQPLNSRTEKEEREHSSETRKSQPFFSKEHERQSEKNNK